MKLEQQVISLDLAKRLKELGVKQDGYYIWKIEKEKYEGEATAYVSPKDGWKLDALYGWLSAFTVAELGEMLPGYECGMTASTTDNPPEGYLDGIELVHVRENGRWITRTGESYYDASNDNYPEFKADTEAEARGLMLEYLITNNLMKV